MNMRIFAGTVLLTVFHIFAAGTAVIAQEHATISFSGRVVDESGKGLGGAHIFMYEYGLTESETEFDRRMVRRITANKDGRFELTAAHGEAPKRLRAVVLAAKLAHSFGWVSWDLRSDVEGTITLGRHGQLGGRIIDKAGNAIANAQVRAVLFRPQLDEDGREWGMDVFDWLVMPTDEQGRFVFTNIPVDVRAEFMVSAQGRVSFFTGQQQPPDRQDQMGQFVAGQEDIAILLPRGGIIEGQAVEKKTGRGVSGVKLRVLPERAYPAESKVLVTDKNGRFRFEGLAEGLYLIGLLEGIADGGTWVTVGAKAQVVAGQVTGGVMIELTPPGILEVEVRDESTGQAIADALVTVERVGDMGGVTFGSTVATGIARIPLMGGQYVLRSVSAEGYKHFAGGETISIAEGQRQRVTVKLSALPKVRGVVRNSSRQAVSGAEVMVLSCSKPVRTDDRGAFELSYDPQDSERKLIFARDTEKNLAAMEELSADHPTIDLVAQPAVILRGRVTDPNGLVGIPRTNVGICLIAGTGRMYLPIRVTTDEAGRYEIAGLPAGQSYCISAWSGDHGAGDVVVAIPAGTVGEFDAKLIKAGVVVVSGKVIDKSNQPVAQASVDLYDVIDKSTFPIKLAHEGTGTTNQYGQYQIERRRRRDVKSSFVIAAAQGYSASCVSHYVGGGRAETIILKPNPGWLAGYVVDSEGIAVPGAKVHAIVSSFKVQENDFRLTAGSTELFTSETDQEGRFEFAHVPNDARAEFAVIAEGYPKTFTWKTEKQLKVEQFRSGEDDIEIVVTRIAGLAGQVIDAATQQGVGGVKVYMSRRRKEGANPTIMWNARQGTVVWSMMEGDNRVVVSDRNGSFSTQGLVAGDYWVFLDPYSNPDRKWVSKMELATVEEGVLGEVTLEATKVAWIKVRVVSQQDNMPVTSTNVRLKHIASADGEQVASNASNRILSVRTDAAGMAMFNLPPGTFAVNTVAARDHVLLDAGGVVTVQADQIEKIDVKIGYEVPVIRGVCIDKSGAPIASAEVGFLPATETTVVTDSEGAFALPADTIKPRDGAEKLYIAAIERQAGMGVIHSIAKERKDVGRIVLTPTKSARGRVIDKDARPIADAQVSIDITRFLEFQIHPNAPPSWVPYRQVVTDSEGIFEIEGLVPSWCQIINATALTYDRYEKYIIARRGVDGQLRATMNSRQLEGRWTVFKTGQDSLDLGDFVLSQSSLSISGILINVMGYPITDMDVYANGTEQLAQKLLKTDSKGQFHFDGLSEGEITLTADVQPGWVGLSATVQAGDQDIVLVLHSEQRPMKYSEWKPNPDFDGATVEVRLVDAATGKAPAITDINVRFSHEMGNSVTRQVGQDGIVCACVGAGRLKLATGKWPVYDNKIVWVDVEKGKRHEVEVQIERRASISGTVVDGDGKPVIGARVEIVPGGSSCETIADGSFSLYWDSARAREKGHAPYTRVTDKRRGLYAVAEIPQTGNIGEIVLLPASEIEIRIQGNQKVIKRVSAYVTLRGPGVDLIMSSARLKDGYFKIERVAPLWAGYTYHVILHGVWPPKEVDITPDELVPGQTKVVEIVLDK